MNFARNCFYFFVYSNLFICLCAVVMAWQTSYVFSAVPPTPEFLCFVFFASLCSYSFHWYLTPADPGLPGSRSRWLEKHRKIHLPLFIAGLAGAVCSALFLLGHWHWLAISAAITFLYSAPKIAHPWFRSLRKIALAKTVFLAFVWMYVTTILPMQVGRQGWSTAFYLFAGSRFFLIYAICIIFDYRDKDHDRSVGIRSLITWLSDQNITRLFIVSLILFAACTGSLLAYGFPSWLVAVLALPGILTAVLYRYALRNRSDVLYYFVLDGLMALSSILTMLPLVRHSK